MRENGSAIASEKRKIGIVTLVGSFNYGNRLQNYAMTRIFQKLGFDVTTLAYSGKSLEKHARTFLSLLLKRKLSFGWNASASGIQSSRRAIAFRSFDEFLRIEPIARIDPDLKKRYDFFSVGSDQCWNPRFMSDPYWYFLEFADRDQRIAACPSFGVSSIPRSHMRAYKKGLSGFRSISVRENEGRELVRRIAGKDACVLIDPTLILTAEEWLSVGNDSMLPGRDYAFIYLLGQSEETIRDLKRVVEDEYALLPIIISDSDDGSEVPAGPAEFVSLVLHASMVITDSFHASVFSLIFKRSLYIVRRQGAEDMSSRIRTLIDKLDLTEKACSFGSVAANSVLFGSDLDARISSERERFYAFLTNTFEASGVSCDVDSKTQRA